MGLAGRDIIVIGAGIGGLAAAAALAQRQARVRVFERASELVEIGAGIQVGPNGVAVLDALGVAEAASRHASVPEAVVLRDFRGHDVAQIALGASCVARYGRPYWHFHRADLLEVLANAARRAGAELGLGHEVVRVDQAVSPTVATADNGCHTAEIVIASDGLRSSVRAALFGRGVPRFAGHVAWRGLVDAGRLPAAFPNVASLTMGPGRHVVTYPLRGGSAVNFVAVEERSEPAPEGWLAEDDPRALRRAFAGWKGAVATLLDAVDTTFLWGLYDHPPLPEWVAGRVALLGDACHPMLPFLAQGATAALEDAWVLAAELDTAPDPEQGLAAYATRRQERAARVQRAAAMNGRLYHLRPGFSDMAHLGLRALARLSPGGLLGRFDWLYEANVVSASSDAA